MTNLSEKVNTASSFIATLTVDPAERIGIAAALMEIYRFEIARLITPEIKEEVKPEVQTE